MSKGLGGDRVPLCEEGTDMSTFVFPLRRILNLKKKALHRGYINLSSGKDFASFPQGFYYPWGKQCTKSSGRLEEALPLKSLTLA